MTTTESQAAKLAEAPPMRADARRSHERLLTAATAAFAEKGADAPLEDIAKRAGVGIGTLYRHFPTRLDLQEAVYRQQVSAVCAQGADLASALIAARGKDSEVISLCSQIIRSTADRLLQRAQEAGAVRADLTTMDVMMLVHGMVVASERTPDQADRLLSIALDGMRSRD